MFIVFEGIDGCGKSTQAKLLAQYYKKNNKEIVETLEPGATKAGQKLRELILTNKDIYLQPESELLLFIADRIEHINSVILPALSENKIVISDRFIYSTIAYQVGGRGFDQGVIDYLNKFSTKGLRPDKVFYIDLEPEKALARVSTKDKFEEEKVEFYHNVRNKYLDLSRTENNFYLIDGNKSIEDIHEEISGVLD